MQGQLLSNLLIRAPAVIVQQLVVQRLAPVEALYVLGRQAGDADAHYWEMRRQVRKRRLADLSRCAASAAGGGGNSVCVA